MRDAVTALTLGQRKDNLPAEVTRFVGRRRELPVLATAIEHHRLVTLRGAGGVGKTRLALRAAHDARDRFADGCWLVGLSALRTPELLARTVAGALGLPDEALGGALDGAFGGSLDVLAESLAERELLLVLDACEHLAQACADLVRVLLEAAPGLRVLATSREPLGVPDEHALLITPLELPADDTQAAYSDAVTLFTERARAAAADLELTARHTAPVIELCRRLDGIPLALELAAVRLRGMPVEEMLARLSDRLRILGIARTATDHQRTLRAALAWSYELCTPAEQRLWAELSVFPGTFGADAVEYVCGPGSSQALTWLAEKSVVLSSPETSRYHLHDTVREFGAELLNTGVLAGGQSGAGPESGAERLRRRHRDYCLKLAEQARDAILTAAQPEWLTRLAAETANIRVALGYSFATPGQEGAGLAMTILLRPYWVLAGQFSEGRRWHGLAAAIDAGSRANAWAVYGAGALAARQGDLAAARPLFDAGAALAAGLGDKDLAAHVTEGRGRVAFYAGEPRAAMAYYGMALAAYRRLGFGDPAALACYTGLASVCLTAGELNRAVGLCDECLRRCDELGEQWARGTALWVRGAARWRSGDFSAAIEDARSCLRIKGPAGDLRAIAMSFDLLAACLAAQPEQPGESERAAVLYGAGEALWALLNAPVLIGMDCAPIRAGAADGARGRLDSGRFEELASVGRTLSLPAAIAIALSEAPAVPDAGAPAPSGTGAPRLTRREKEIAGLVAAGLANREIAARLYLSKRTVDSHLEHIFAKLGFTARTQLISWVRARGVLAGASLAVSPVLAVSCVGRCHPCQ
jgi:predicted ATPase/DNA-binding CsgD family transcriptional regulator